MYYLLRQEGDMWEIVFESASHGKVANRMRDLQQQMGGQYTIKDTVSVRNMRKRGVIIERD